MIFRRKEITLKRCVENISKYPSAYLITIKIWK